MMSMETDRLRKMLDAVIADHDGGTQDMAAQAFVSAATWVG